MLAHQDNVFQETCETIFRLNQDEKVRYWCQAREEADRIERTIEHDYELYKKSLAEKDAIIAEQDNALAEKDSTIAEKDSTIAEKDSTIAENMRLLAEQDNALAVKNSIIAENMRLLAEKDAQIARLMTQANHK